MNLVAMEVGKVEEGMEERQLDNGLLHGSPDCLMEKSQTNAVRVAIFALIQVLSLLTHLLAFKETITTNFKTIHWYEIQ